MNSNSITRVVDTLQKNTKKILVDYFTEATFLSILIRKISYTTQIKGLKKGKTYNVYLTEDWCPPRLKGCLTFTGTYDLATDRYDGRPIHVFKNCMRGKKKLGTVNIESDSNVYRVEEASANATRRISRRGKKMRKSTRRNRRN
jgi:hypothetical protein